MLEMILMTSFFFLCKAVNTLFLFQYRVPEVASRQNLLILNNLDTANEHHEIDSQKKFSIHCYKAGEKKKAVVTAEVCGEINNKQKAVKTVIMVYYYNILFCRPCVQEWG